MLLSSGRQTDRPGGARVGIAATTLLLIDTWPTPALAIGDGHLADTCQYPSVVNLRGTRPPVELCTGAYIGGRVILTAAHCFDNRGFQIDRTVFETETNTVAPLCSNDSDCPSVTIQGQTTNLSCKGQEPNEFLAEQGECYLPNHEISNYFLHAYFGEAYEPYGIGHPTRSVPISYCHINPDYLDDPDNEAYDFAYCILAEEPDVQPIPIMMHCEVDAFMNGQYDLDVRAVGFGLAGPEMDVPADKSGRKRWASSSTLTASFSSTDLYLSLALFDTFDPGGPRSGDSGSPLLVRLPPPHNTWRVFGIMVKPLLAVPPWQYMDWMHNDPEVVASGILPCHTSAGAWNPTEACGGFPLSPGDSVGDWAFGPKACNNTNISGSSATCGAPFGGSPLTEPGDDLNIASMPAPEQPGSPGLDPYARPGGGAPGCSVGDKPSDRGLLLIGLPIVALLWRRRRAQACTAVFVSFFISSGCTDDTLGSDDEIGDTGGEPPPAPVELNLAIHDTHSGIQLEDTGYDQLAVGNVARSKGDATCCQDIALGGRLSPDVEVFFGGGSTENGLTFLDDRPPQAYAMAATGDGIVDLALADLDNDGLNDLVSLTTRDQLGVRLGVTATPYFGALNLYPASASGAKELGRLSVGDLDCDADLDVAVTAPNNAGLVLLPQTSGGAFGTGMFVPTALAAGELVAGNPQDVAIGDLDAGGALDLVSINDDGTVTTYLQRYCDMGVTSTTTKTVYSDVGDCPSSGPHTCIPDTWGAHVTTEDVFCDTPLSDITVAFADRVFTFCNSGDINAAIGLSGVADYLWDVNGSSQPSSTRLTGIEWWPAPGALYALVHTSVLRLTDPGTEFNDSTTPKVLGLRGSGTPDEFLMTRHSDDGVSDWWQRLIWTSNAADDSGLGFVR